MIDKSYFTKFYNTSFTSIKNIDESAQDWDRFEGAQIPSSLELNPVIYNFISPQDKVLDVGMGFGKTLFELQNKGFKYLSGIDSNKSGIEFAKKIRNTA